MVGTQQKYEFERKIHDNPREQWMIWRYPVLYGTPDEPPRNWVEENRPGISSNFTGRILGASRDVLIRDPTPS